MLFIGDEVVYDSAADTNRIVLNIDIQYIPFPLKKLLDSHLDQDGQGIVVNGSGTP